MVSAAAIAASSLSTSFHQILSKVQILQRIILVCFMIFQRPKEFLIDVHEYHMSYCKTVRGYYGSNISVRIDSNENQCNIFINFYFGSLSQHKQTIFILDCTLCYICMPLSYQHYVVPINQYYDTSYHFQLNTQFQHNTA